MSDIKDKLSNAAHDAGDAANRLGHGIAEGSDAGVGGIRERMDVIASCGTKVGVVDHADAGVIKLTRKDSTDGLHHFIPTGWVDHVDSHVHLRKNSVETRQGWQSDAASCARCEN